MAENSSRADVQPQAVEPILEALQAGVAPEENFRRLFLLYHRAVYGFFRRRGLSPEDCHDLTQETFFGIHRGMGTFRLGEPFEPWLFTIASNAYRKHRRYHSAVLRQGQEVPLDVAAEDPSVLLERRGPEDEVLRQERTRLLREAIDRLPEQMRACLVLRLDRGLKYREIATVLKRSIETVKTHLFQARQRLQAELDDAAGRREEAP